jgi:uncharacterized protein (TIGR03118 family)
MRVQLVPRKRATGAALAMLALVAIVAMTAGSSLASSQSSKATAYAVTNLVSDGFVPAAHTDPNLVNGWGIAASPSGSPWWVANNETDTSTLYDQNGVAQGGPLVVKVEGAPTGMVFNGGSDFVIHDSAGNSGVARFLFATESGTIRGWSPAVPPPPLSTKSFLGVRRGDGAIYKGLAIAGSTLYAADFHNSRVDMFNGSFKLISAPGAFKDPNLPDGYGPFGIQNLGGTIYVTYAKQDADREDEIAGPHLGFVDAYTTGGALIRRVASGGDLNAPWGLAWAPATGFGQFSGDLLVGNFGDGRINAFHQEADGHFTFAGQLRGTTGSPIVIDGLWGIGFGNGGVAGPTTTLFFAAGPDDEEHGLFGRIDVH